ncbi:MAG: hypothetical protein D6715_07225 [Calditrichaeota bacterium]|nr:MAG: hypothetical protein D6715_07225 [Calditrichota bacterium]
MKSIISLWLLVAFAVAGGAQQVPASLHPKHPGAPTARVLEKASRLDLFYQQHGTMQMAVHPDFATALFSYFREPFSQRAFGVIAGVAPLSRTTRGANGFTDVQTHALLFPLWLSLKIRLTNSPSAHVVPYLIGGFGPSFALDYGPNRQVNLNFSNSHFLAGGTAFAGAGVDYLWARDWAISADLRYIVLRYPSAVVGRTNLDGLSFSIGIVHGFGF